ncbi:unnamed protein product [Microthlaspi erraticum]|uniref:Uncharacterized protein n=1 Tax=Microthlaspi erraticum TaxID=1685480 RepID=A0A6D2KE96_9BRAS|nr:unnamed protein product [Microthlaspi erraticum]
MVFLAPPSTPPPTLAFEDLLSDPTTATITVRLLRMWGDVATSDKAIRLLLVDHKRLFFRRRLLWVSYLC